VIARFSSSESNRSPAGQPDDVGVAGCDGQHPVTITGDDEWRRRVVFFQVLRHVLEVVDPGTGAGIRNLRGLELFPHITGAEPDLQAAIAEQIQGLHVPTEQGRFIERGVEHIHTQPQCRGDHRDRGQRRERCRGAQMVWHTENVETGVLGALGLVEQRLARLEEPHAHSEAEISGHQHSPFNDPTLANYGRPRPTPGSERW
jgi:hypothetical protein